MLLMLAVSLLGSLMRSASMALDVSGDLFFAQWLNYSSTTDPVRKNKSPDKIPSLMPISSASRATKPRA